MNSFLKKAPALPAGNYLFVRAAEEELVYELKAFGGISYKIVNNNRGLAIALHTKKGSFISNAALSINSKAFLRWKKKAK